jgi:hypothetical protein
MNAYVPSNLDIDLLLAENPPYDKIKSFNKEYLIYLINLPYSLPTIIKDLDTHNGVPFYSVMLKRQNKYYSQYLKYLIANNILIKTLNYSVKRHSNYYKYSENYQNTGFKEIQLNNVALIDKILRQKYRLYKKNGKIENNLNKGSGGTPYSNLENPQNHKINDIPVDLFYTQLESLQKLEVNDKVYDEIEKIEDLEKRIYSQICIDKIKNNEFYSKRDTTSYRHHSNITSLKKKLRNYLTIEGKTLVNIDIKNSQPYFSLMLLKPDIWFKNNLLLKEYFEDIPGKKKKLSTMPQLKRFVKKIPNEEINNYRDIILSGRFYEYFLEKINSDLRIKGQKELIREEIKLEVLKFFFSTNHYQSDIKKIFKSNFPKILRLLSLIKKHKNERLAIILQRLESFAIIDQICCEIKKDYPQIPVLTIHDSLVTTENNEKWLKEYISIKLYEITGEYPRLSDENRWDCK